MLFAGICFFRLNAPLMTLLSRILIACFLLLPLPAASAQPEEIDLLILQGQQALAAGQAEQAALIFERVVLEQPWRLGVWLDYALALQQSGERDSAQAIYRYLLGQNPPDHLLPWLKQQAQSESPLAAGWVSAGRLTMLAGRDSNLNRAPSVDSLTLTLPTGPLALPLMDSAKASAGTAGLLGASWLGARQTANGSDWLVQAGLNARAAPGINDQDYLQASVGVTYRWHDAAAEENLAAFSVRHLQYGGTEMQRALRAGIYRGQPWRDAGRGNCVLHYGGEWESLGYPSAAVLDGQYLGLAADIGCEQRVDWQLQARAGIDLAEHRRPGGDQRRFELHGLFKGRIGAGQWQAEADYVRQQDTQGYSQLLGNNAVRNNHYWSFGLEYAHPLATGLQGVVSIETFRQNSNLPLFAMHGNAAWLGLRRSF